MKKAFKNNIIEKSKRDALESILNNQYYKIIKAGVFIVGGIYISGHIIGVLAFTNSKIKLPKSTFN